MRFLSVISCGVFLSSLSFGQILNAGFEDWQTDLDTNKNPVAWQTSNSYPIVNVEPFAPGHSGNFAMKVKTVDIGFPFPGVAILQTPYAFAQVPTGFSAWVKSTIMPGDRAYLILALMKGDSVIASVDSCTFKIDSSYSQFTHLQFRIALQSQLAPDSLLIMVASGLLGGTIGTELIVDDIAFTSGGPTNVLEKRELPGAFSLAQNFPNPFNPSTTIRYELPRQSRVVLSVFTTLGQRVALLVDGVEEAGHHEVHFNASGLASGAYFYRLEAENFVESRALLLLR
jgi:hypothetical protein